MFRRKVKNKLSAEELYFLNELILNLQDEEYKERPESDVERPSVEIRKDGGFTQPEAPAKPTKLNYCHDKPEWLKKLEKRVKRIEGVLSINNMM